MIVPGSPNALLLAQSGDPLDEYGKIERSVRFRASVGGYFSRTPSSSGNQKTFTLRACCKRGKLSTLSHLYAVNSASTNVFTVAFVADDTIRVLGRVGGTDVLTLNTRAVYRDPGAHLDIHVQIDTTQATPADRARLYVNGSIVTSFGTAIYPAQNTALPWNSSSYLHQIGREEVGPNFIDAYVSALCFVDGAALPPAAFGLFHPRTGQWRPRSKASVRAAVAAAGVVRNGWGVNGFFLLFDDPTSLTTLGYDRSQSDTDTTGNNWTATNISLTSGATYDSMLDTPTNNYATLNPLLRKSSGISSAATSNGNLSGANAAGVGGWSFVGCTQVIKSGSGVFYFECKTVSGGEQFSVGVQRENTPFNSTYLVGDSGDTNGFSYSGVGSKVNGTSTAYGTAAAAGDVIGVLVNASIQNAASITFFKNGVSMGLAFAEIAGDLMPAISSTSYSSGLECHLNFGQRPFAFPPPSVFKALCTKNLPFPKIPNAKSAFVAVTDTGANIATALANARVSWPDYIDIIKRRDAAEGWRWVFSDDVANYLDSSNAAAKAAVPSFSGTAYVGYSLKVSAANGVATGRLAHVNGVADTVVDGLTNSRKMVFLKNEASGTWFVYHPDLTNGKLLYLDQNAAETADATISSVTASGFTVAAALASGTYRWVSIAEVEGVLKLFTYTGNASTDGPFSNCSHLPAFFMLKNKDAVQTWLEWDNVRETKNPEVTQIYPNQTTAELIDSVNNLCDFVSQGIKYRGASSPGNGSGNTIVGMSLAAFPFRYANAR